MPLIIGSRIKVLVDNGIRKQFRKLGRETGMYKDHLKHAVHIEYKKIHKKYNKAIKYNMWHHMLTQIVMCTTHVA